MKHKSGLNNTFNNKDRNLVIPWGIHLHNYLTVITKHKNLDRYLRNYINYNFKDFFTKF